MKSEWLDRIDESLVKTFYEAQTEKEKEEGFKDELTFGTAGIRSTFGLGPGRLNAFTIRKVALGLAQYLNEKFSEPSIVIHFDTRLLSKAFSEEMASVLAENNVTTILSENYKSTPELSFAVRHLKTDAGVMITASHNPKHYNGIKIYDQNGGQLLPDESERLSHYINAIEYPLQIHRGDFNALLQKNQIQYMSHEVTEAYKHEVKSLVDTIPEKEAKVVLTSLHGTSLPLASEILTELNYDNFVIEKEQSMPDGNFPTVAIANPEDEAVFERGLKLANDTDAQLIIATDPDADRLGFIERYNDNEYRYFNGNEIGILLTKLRFQDLADEGKPLYMVKSIVTSELAERLAIALDVEVKNVLTGFKYISDLLEQESSEQEKQLLLAFEESHGYLAKPFSRDKDAIQMIPLLIKYKNLLANNGMTFKDTMEDIYAHIGSYKDKTLSPSFEGAEGVEKISKIMNQFRNKEVSTICGLEVKQIEDYELGTIKNIKEGTTEALTLPKTNLIRFIFENGFIALRPSGTEPKIKLYFSLNIEHMTALTDQFKDEFINNIK
ncbi:MULTISPECIES: phospho-sugar mutase [Staphylococcus]|jgi:phosphoglucomutase|uniref:Phosphoglucomutase n=1 Tax=Staphylococcus nepalensis TaxID=214473 RepID=A0A380GMD3_9STAP|nr:MULTISPECIES: phospho-sugar mutase [Staphylococcus]VDG67560.1 phosphoglucomutase/phosphomannomutase alpha/beta/alpha domain I [Lacrimispora indolis]MBO1204572.1 phospho-sugar mutase [Staphylococcus nepalensis]MBO1213946.1 phospho-sugar mutase [Staphylococcus nepalensis]MBO1217002.1 phospho-sugar mutase [Staphylococcus nepalensis]MBO1227920.1 phospho-sugar mutase [Staphylococcus nepalensis]